MSCTSIIDDFCKKYFVALQSIPVEAGIYVAIINRLPEVVKELIKLPEVNVNSELFPLLPLALMSRSKEVVNLIISHKGVDIKITDSFSCTPLMVAIDVCDYGSVKTL